MLLFLSSLASLSAEPKRVLLLDLFEPHFSPYSAFIGNLRTDLAQQSSEPIDFYEASLWTARFVEGEMEGPFVEYLVFLFVQPGTSALVWIGGFTL